MDNAERHRWQRASYNSKSERSFVFAGRGLSGFAGA
jgi:hypothetical protein